jgi:hypothetical protein
MRFNMGTSSENEVNELKLKIDPASWLFFWCGTQ